jgi:putative ABC transport system substrate-binding protein
MKRREFITLLGGAAAWPIAARAQQRGFPVIGYFSLGSDRTGDPFFRKGLSDTGYVVDQNVAIEYRSANNDTGRLPELAADLVRRRVAVIFIPGSAAAVLAAKAATTTIPIIFYTGADPVQAGLVSNFDRPGGNVTGVSTMNIELGAKRLGLLHDLLPRAARIAVLVNPSNALAGSVVADVQAATVALGLQVEILIAGTNDDIDTAFASLAQKRVDALLVSPDPLFMSRRVQLATLAVRHAMPAIYPFREIVEAGGLMSYGSSATDLRQVGVYTGRVLNGERPSDLPVIRATKFEFVINLQTAKALDIAVPSGLLAIADEVIE